MWLVSLAAEPTRGCLEAGTRAVRGRELAALPGSGVWASWARGFGSSAGWRARSVAGCCRSPRGGGHRRSPGGERRRRSPRCEGHRGTRRSEVHCRAPRSESRRRHGRFELHRLTRRSERHRVEGYRSGPQACAAPYSPRPEAAPYPVGTAPVRQVSGNRPRHGRPESTVASASARAPGSAPAPESTVAWGGFLCALCAAGVCGAGWGTRSDRGGAAARPVQAFRHSGERGQIPPGHARARVTPLERLRVGRVAWLGRRSWGPLWRSGPGR